MSLKIRKSGTPTDATTVKYRSGSGWAQPSAVKRRVSGTWVQVWPSSSALSASINPTSIYGSSGVAAVTTDTATVTATGGSGSYSYSWSRISGDTVTTRTSPTVNTSTWYRGSMIAGGSYQSVWRCTVSDGTSSVSVDITVNLSRDEVGTCVAVMSYLKPYADDRAGQVAVNDELLITDPFGDDQSVIWGTVRKSETYTTEVARVTLANGAWLECSMTAPLATPEGYVLCRDLVHQRIASASADQLIVGSDVAIEWSEVVSVEQLGLREVQLIYVDDRAFWASGDGQRFILHHNVKA